MKDEPSWIEGVVVIAAVALAVGLFAAAKEAPPTPTADVAVKVETKPKPVRKLVKKAVQLVVPAQKPTLAPVLPTYSNYAAADAEAKRLGRPLVVISVLRTGCPPCEALKRGPLANAAVKAWLARNAVVCKLQDTQAPLGVRHLYPLVWVRPVEGNGSVFGGGIGVRIATKPSEFLLQIQRAANP